MSATLTGARVALLALAALLATAVLISPSLAASQPSVVVRTAKNAKLGKTILVNANGRTLYDLSVERKGKFICTDKMCLSFWHPLVVRAGAKPAGTPGLATIKRPDGRRQVTFRGAPLYTFSGDHKRGDVNGEGFKDVGIWHAASPRASSPAPAPNPPAYPYPH
jgi:predicted lipoprotein with Yx(FWY)xxD motif